MSKKSRAIAPITPRQPLTKKAYKAIEVWAVRRCKGLTIYNLLIKYTLEAERMSRENLYSRLDHLGYKWNGVYWQEPVNEKVKKQ